MTTDFQLLERDLECYFAAISAQKSEAPPALRPHMDKLDHWEKALGPSAPADLRHYLQRKSYAKALEYLQGLRPVHRQ